MSSNINITKPVDTVRVNMNTKVPFIDVPIHEFNIENLVLNSEIVPTKRSGIVSNFAFAYYMKDGKPHRFTLVVYGMKGLPIYDVSFVEIDQASDNDEARKSKHVVMDVDYANDKIHKSIVDTLLAVHDRILSIISRSPELLKLSFDDVSYKQNLSEYAKMDREGSGMAEEDFWYQKLLRIYSEEKFISKDLFRKKTTMHNGVAIEDTCTDDEGNFLINDQPFSCFFSFRERRDSKTHEPLPVLIDKDRKQFLFDDVKGFQGILGKMSIDIGMTNLMKTRGLKIHSTITGGFLMSLTQRSGGVESYINDVDPSLMVSGVTIPKKTETSDDSSEISMEDEYASNDMVTFDS